jgi:hypothetical protein
MGRRIRCAVGRVVLVVCICMSSAALLGQSRPRLLEGVEKMTARVVLRTQDPLPSGLTRERLQTLVELKLRTSGLRVLSDEEDSNDPDIIPRAILNVMILRTEDGRGPNGFAFSTRLIITEIGISERNKSRGFTELWSQASLNVSSLDTANTQVERITGILLDGFVNDWLKANPRISR